MVTSEVLQPSVQRQPLKRGVERVGSPETKNRLTRTLRDVVAFQTIADGQHQEEMRGIFDYLAEKVALVEKETGRKFVRQEWNNEGHLSTIITPVDPTQVDEQSLLHPKMAMLIHADVVNAEDKNMFIMRSEGDDLIGRGTLDMKGGLAIGIDLLSELPIGAALIVTSDEEIGGEHGAKFLAQTIGVQPEFLIILDGQKTEHISYGAKGGLHAKITFGSVLNTGGHGSRHEDYSATELCMDVRNILRTHYPWRYGHSPVGTTFNVGVMEGGVATNKIAENASIKVDMRFPSNDAGESAKGNLYHACEEVVRQRLHEIYGAQLPVDLVAEVKMIDGKEVYSVDIIDDKTNQRYTVAQVDTLAHLSVYDINRDDPRIRRFQEIVEEITGEAVKINEKDTGLHDGEYWPDVPAIVYLPAGSGAHTSNERVSATSLVQTREAIARLMHETLD